MNRPGGILGLVACMAAVGALGLTPVGPITAPFEFYRNAIWLEVRLNGSRPLHFLFDTAAGSCVLNRSVVGELKLPILTEFDQPNAGSGDNPTRITVLPAAKIEFLGVALDFPQIVALPLDEVAASYGTRIDGIIGYPLMARYVVHVDFDARTLTLTEPASFTYAGTGAVLPFEGPADAREPIVHARFVLPGTGVIDGAFLVDEPHPHCLLFATPFARTHDLPTASVKLSSRLVPGRATGVGGQTPYQVGRLEYLELGASRLSRPTAGFADSRGGAFARSDIAGIIGGEILRRFRVTFDFARRRLILEPGRAFNEPFDWDASGLKLRAAGPDFRRFQVVDVVADSPASRADVRVGDTITTLDGRPAGQWTLWEIERLFQKADQVHTLALDRAGSVLSVTLTTRALI